MIIIIISILYIPKVGLSWNISASLIQCVYEQPDWSQIIFLSANTCLGFSLKNSLYVHIVIILLRQGGIFYLSVNGTRSLGIWSVII